MEIIGTKIAGFNINKMELKPVFNNNIIRGSVIFVDNYGNAISNITKKELIFGTLFAIILPRSIRFR